MYLSSVLRCAVVLAPCLVVPVQAADIHACKLSPDKRSVSVLVSNPYAQETHCTVNCHVAIPGSGVASISCTRMVPGGAKDFELCARERDGGAEYVRLSDSGNSECVKPLAEEKADTKDDDETIDQDEILKRMQRGEPPQNWMKK